jgi:hypothetical protein
MVLSHSLSFWEEFSFGLKNWEFGVLLASKVERELVRKIWMQFFYYKNGM